MQELCMNEGNNPILFQNSVSNLPCNLNHLLFTVKMKNITTDDAIRASILKLRDIQIYLEIFYYVWSNTHHISMICNVEMYQQQWPQSTCSKYCWLPTQKAIFPSSCDDNALTRFLVFALILSEKRYLELSKWSPSPFH